MKVKVCGITLREEIKFLNKMPPDYIGLVFCQSKRRVTKEIASLLCKDLNKDIKKVGVFRNNSLDYIKEIIKYVPLDILQLHGEEDNYFIEKVKLLNKEVWKGVCIKSREDIVQAFKYKVNTLVLDGSNPGSGRGFDLEAFEGISTDKRIILAGGINENNLLLGVDKIHPYAVDLSSGIEIIDKNGIRKKDENMTINFIKKVREINERKI